MQTNSVVPLWVYNCNPGQKYNKRQEVNSAAISNDGSLIAAGTFFHDYSLSKHRKPQLPDSQFFIYCFESTQSDPANPQPKYQWEINSDEGIYWVDISGDGSVVAAGGIGFVLAYRTSDGSQVLSASTKSRVNELVLSDDGTWLAVASDKLYLYKYDGSQYRLTDAFESPQAAYSVSMSSDGSLIVISDYNSGQVQPGQLFLLSNNNGSITVANSFTLNDSYSHCVHMNNSGSYFVSGGANNVSKSEPGDVYFFDVASFRATGKPTWIYPLSGIVYNVFVNDQGQVAAVCNNGAEAGFVALFDKTGRQVWMKPVERNPNSTTIASKYLTVASGHPNNTPSHFYLLNIETGDTIWRYDLEEDMSWPMAICQSGTHIVVGSDNQQVYCFEP